MYDSTCRNCGSDDTIWIPSMLSTTEMRLCRACHHPYAADWYGREVMSSEHNAESVMSSAEWEPSAAEIAAVTDEERLRVRERFFEKLEERYPGHPWLKNR